MIPLREIFGGMGNRLFQLAYIYAQAKKGNIPDTYLQDEKYFAPFQEEIKALYRQGVTPNDYISLHVRRGDYINNPVYADLTQTDYYERAMELFPGEKFLVFCADRQEKSDDKSDMEWCKEKFKGEQFVFQEGKDEVEDFNMMAGAKGHILANSSFSFWAAYVGGGRTVAPKEWYANYNAVPPSFPNEWTII